MGIAFRTKALRRQYEKSSFAVRAYGEQVARKYVQRIGLIKQVRDIGELQKLPGLDCHPLKGDRAGQWAVKLTGFYRLIFTLEGDRLEIALIEEVSKHYDD
ncbi:MAG: type II toxin-antitoxin system RelE/ParE family toxin [Candidatus Eisenbacteria bacterium]|nr:type II toxin-antitoxin system RelE/ParE family toxin [Candidatus Eisenbacteria bacterium]